MQMQSSIPSPSLACSCLISIASRLKTFCRVVASLAPSSCVHHELPGSSPGTAYPPPGTAYPPPGQQAYQPPAYVAPPPATYPQEQYPAGADTKSRGGDGFWKGCCAALCCCCLLDMCF